MFETRGEVGNARRLGYKSRILVSLRVLMTITVQSILLGALFVVRVVMGLGCVHWGPPGAPSKCREMPIVSNRFCLQVGCCTDILVVTLVMQFYTAAEQQQRKANIRRL